MAAAFLKNLIGDTVIDGKGESKEISSVCTPGKTIGLYFSAHWCPPCRGFTPKLAEFYMKMAGKLEVIFLSSDNDEASFKEYFSEMPWLALPYDNRTGKGKASKHFKVKGIPTFVLLDGETGKTITLKAREKVQEDPDGKNFPWVPKTFLEIMEGAKYLEGEEEKPDLLKRLQSKEYFGIYFSAHWCPPCRSFTPEFAKFYKNMKEENKEFEVVFASSDRDESSFKEYFKEMPWLSLPFQDRDRKTELSNLFDVEGIPTLAILQRDGKVITTNGRTMVGADKEGKDFPWSPKPFNSISVSVDEINAEKCLVVFAEKDHMEVLNEAMKETAEREFKKGTAEENESQKETDGESKEENGSFKCIYASSEDELTESLREFCKLGDKIPYMAMIEMEEQKKWICEDFDITDVAATKTKIEDFVKKCQDNTIPSKGIQE